MIESKFFLKCLNLSTQKAQTEARGKYAMSQSYFLAAASCTAGSWCCSLTVTGLTAQPAHQDQGQTTASWSAPGGARKETSKPQTLALPLPAPAAMLGVVALLTLGLCRTYAMSSSRLPQYPKSSPLKQSFSNPNAWAVTQ